MNYIEYLGNTFDEKNGEWDKTKANEFIKARQDKINILILGASGVGKSSLINSFFGEEVAAAHAGRPVTQKLEKYYFSQKGLILWDTKGIEAKDYEETRQDLIDELDKANSQAVNTKSIDALPHVAWLCIKESSARIEEREIELVKLVAKYRIPVVVVFTNTQFESGDEFVGNAKKIFDTADCSQYIQGRYVRVNSIEYKMRGMTIPRSGLDELLTKTEEAFPEGEKNAKVALEKAQIVDNKKKLQAMIESSKTKIHLAAAAAGTAGASPIPGSDAPIIAAIQSTLIYTINLEFQLDNEISKSSSLIAGILGITGIAQLGKAIVSNALKFIPGVGSLLGGAISATTAIAITEALGHAYIKALVSFFDQKEGRVILPENTQLILDAFSHIFKLSK